MITLSEMFLSGNILFMSILTLMLASTFLAAWKAPAWLLGVGRMALASGIFFTLLGFYQIYGEVQLAGDVPFTVLCGGYKCAIITAAYGLVIYVISIILEICKKPRI